MIMYEDKYSGSPFEENSSERVNDQQETISQYGEMHQENGNRYGSYDYRYNGTPAAERAAANQKARKKSSFGRTGLRCNRQNHSVLKQHRHTRKAIQRMIF